MEGQIPDDLLPSPPTTASAENSFDDYELESPLSSSDVSAFLGIYYFTLSFLYVCVCVRCLNLLTPFYR